MVAGIREWQPLNFNDIKREEVTISGFTVMADYGEELLMLFRLAGLKRIVTDARTGQAV